MSKIFIPANKPEDWKTLLAEPDKHWKKGCSARALAYCWQEADGFPESVRNVLMLVHSFSQANEGFDDYCQFLALFGLSGIKPDSLVFA